MSAPFLRRKHDIFQKHQGIKNTTMVSNAGNSNAAVQSCFDYSLTEGLSAEFMTSSGDEYYGAYVCGSEVGCISGEGDYSRGVSVDLRTFDVSVTYYVSSHYVDQTITNYSTTTFHAGTLAAAMVIACIYAPSLIPLIASNGAPGVLIPAF